MSKLLVIDPTVICRLQKLAKNERKECLIALCDWGDGFGQPHVHSRLGIRKLGSNLFECRGNCDLRFIFQDCGTGIVRIVARQPRRDQDPVAPSQFSVNLGASILPSPNRDHESRSRLSGPHDPAIFHHLHLLQQSSTCLPQTADPCRGRSQICRARPHDLAPRRVHPSGGRDQQVVSGMNRRRTSRRSHYDVSRILETWKFPPRV